MYNTTQRSAAGSDRHSVSGVEVVFLVMLIILVVSISVAVG